MRIPKAGILVLIVIAVAAEVACGGPSAKQREEERNRFDAAVIAGDAARTRVANALTRQVESQSCETELRPLVDALGDLNSRLSVGLSFQDYSKNVGDVRVAYDQVTFDALSSDCTSKVGIPAENALNDYVRAYNTWNDCIGNVDCSTDSIDSQLQPEWAKATTRVDKAKANLTAMTTSAIPNESDPQVAYVRAFATRFCGTTAATSAGRKLCDSIETVQSDGTISSGEAKTTKSLIEQARAKLSS